MTHMTLETPQAQKDQKSSPLHQELHPLIQVIAPPGLTPTSKAYPWVPSPCWNQNPESTCGKYVRHVPTHTLSFLISRIVTDTGLDCISQTPLQLGGYKTSFLQWNMNRNNAYHFGARFYKVGASLFSFFYLNINVPKGLDATRFDFWITAWKRNTHWLGVVTLDCCVSKK